jgi:hypothetical protein
MPIDSNKKYQSRTIATIYNACKTKLNAVLADNNLEGVVDINPSSPKPVEISGKEGVYDRTLGIYCNGAGTFQQGFDINEPPMVQVVIDLLLRDSDTIGLSQNINRYADVMREFIDGIEIGSMSIVASQDTTILEVDKRNRLAFLFIVWFDPMTDLDQQGLDLSLIE